MARKPPSNKAANALAPAASGSQATFPATPLYLAVSASSHIRGYPEDEIEEADNDDGEPRRSTEGDEDGDAQTGFARSAMAERIWARLNLRADLELADIQIRMERDTVRVTGFVATDAARRRIADCVGACAGVRVIRNGIRLAR